MPLPSLLFRDYSLAFDPNYYSDSPEVARAIDAILAIVTQHLKSEKGAQRLHIESLRKHVQAITLDVYLAYKNQPFIFRGISRRSGAYTLRANRYAAVQLAYRPVIAVLDSMIALGLIFQKNGIFDWRTNSRYVARIWADGRLKWTPNLRQVFKWDTVQRNG